MDELAIGWYAAGDLMGAERRGGLAFGVAISPWDPRSCDPSDGTGALRAGLAPSGAATGLVSCFVPSILRYSI